MAKLTDLWVNIGAKTADFDKAADKIGGKMKQLAGLVAGAFAVSKIQAFVFETAKLAGEVEGVSIAFRKIATPGLLEDLRKATKGTVTDLELMKNAVQANNFQIPLNQLASLLQFANKRAQDTGQSVDYLVNSIVMGIGRKSPLILDNLGISATRLKKNLKGVGLETASVGDIANAVGKVIQEEMGKAGDVIETSAIKTAQLNTSFANLQAVIGSRVNPALNQLKEYALQAMSNLSLVLFGGTVAKSEAGKKLDELRISLKGVNEEAAKKVISDELDKVNLAVNQGEKDLKDFGTVAGAILKNKYSDAWVAARNELELTLETNKALMEGLMNFDYRTIPGANPDVPDVINKTNEELEREKKLLAEIQANLGQHVGLGRSRNEVRQLPSPGESQIIIPDRLDTKPNKDFIESTDELIKKNAEAARSFNTMQTAAEQMGDSMIGAFGNLDSVKDFGNAIRDTARQVILSVIAQTMAENMAKAARGSKTWWGAILQGAAAATATSALFKMIPSFAEGGVTKGPTLAMVGDNPSGKEAMIPSELWGKLGSTKITGELQLRGKDAYWLIKNYSDFLNKTT